jgi:hypothetical protein
LCYREVSVDFFSALVDYSLDTMRGAPMLEDFTRVEIEVKKRQSQERAVGGLGLVGIMRRASDDNRVADKEFVKACLKLLQDKLNGKLTSEQFAQGCEMLDDVADKLNPSGRRRG